MDYVADFETTGEENLKRDGHVRVWAVQVRAIDTEKIVLTSNNINDFMKFLLSRPESSKIYFHNLKFDGSFIIDKLLRSGVDHLEQGEKPRARTFDSLITNLGVFFSITVYLRVYNKRYIKVEIFDSLKKIPFSIEKIAKAFKMDVGKKKMSEDFYKRYRPIDYNLTEEDVEYLNLDTLILARAMKTQLDKGLSKMTLASDAMQFFKNTLRDKEFDYLFPKLNITIDNDIRASYKGGWTYLSPRFAKKPLSNVGSWDVNSLYPFVMYTFPLPYGEPVYFKGRYKVNKSFPLYIQAIEVDFTIKKDHLPTIQAKGNFRFVPTEYVTTTNGEPILLILTSVDLELLLEHYDVHYIEYLEGFMFKSKVGIFKDYIDYWMAIKMENEDGPLRTLAKLMLNALYGKFGMNPKRQRKTPYLDKEADVVRYIKRDVEEADTVYTALASFVTSYARAYTIRHAQMNFKRFIYADTDSIHLIGSTPPEGVEVDPLVLGKWKFEGTASRCKFLRAKTYLKVKDGKTLVTCAGLPVEARENVRFGNFRGGSVFHGKLQAKKVKGGTVLATVDFSIKA